MKRLGKKFRKLARFSLVKTLLFNYHYFGWKGLLHFYVICSKTVRLQRLRGEVQIDRKITGGIRIGFAEVQGIDYKTCYSIWNNSGTVVFRGSAHLCCGAKIDNEGLLELGDEIKINGDTKIICKEHIILGDDCLLSWGTSIMDTDFHTILNKGTQINFNEKIEIGSHCWIGCNCILLKGVSIPMGCVVAAGSVVTKKIEECNAIIVNNEVKSTNIQWEY